MAVRYAVANGNWSNTATWDGGTLPTSDDDVFANNFTVTIDQDVTVLSIRNTSNTSPAVTAGGSFNLLSNITITCTGIGIRNGLGTCINFQTGGTSYINSNIALNHASHCIDVSLLSTLYIVGEVTTIVGNGFAAINVRNQSTIYITGSVRVSQSAGSRCIILSNNSDCFITGNVSMISGGNANNGILINIENRCEVIGNVFYETTVSSNANPIVNNGRLKVIGILNANSASNVGERSVITGTGGTGIFSGPFIFGSYGSMPFSVATMFLSNNTSTYIEFADATTNGALSPLPPPTRETMYSPNTLADSPPQSDVRDGVIYALDSQTGTLKVPPPSTVMLGVPTDNTTGTGIFTPDALFDSILNETHPIAKRLKNVATVDTTGAQISSN
jgi:hypothetical protein